MGEPFKSWLYFYYIQHSMVSYPDTLIVAYVFYITLISGKNE